jgi:hypothetical protein
MIKVIPPQPGREEVVCDRCQLVIGELGKPCPAAPSIART